MLPAFSPWSAFGEVGFGANGLALDREDDVGAAALGIVEQHFPRRTAGRHVGHDEARASGGS